jgi:hypothetical protein
MSCTIRIYALISLLLMSLTPILAQASTYIIKERNLTSVPGFFSPCADDFETCQVSNPDFPFVTVFYGARGNYVVAQGTGDFTCSPAAFGIPDPLQNVKKTCWIYSGFIDLKSNNVVTSGSPSQAISSQVPAMRGCAVDFKECLATGLWTGYYGANGKFVKIAGIGKFECAPASFGIDDPLQNVQKTCYVQEVYFGSVGLSDASGSIGTEVPGVTLNVSMLEMNTDTKIWGVHWVLKPGDRVINNVPSTGDFYFVPLLSNVPADYTVNGQGQSYPTDGSPVKISTNNQNITVNVSYSVNGKTINSPSVTFK